MAGFLEKLGIKRGGDAKTPPVEGEAKSLFGRKKKVVAAEGDVPAEAKPAKSIRWRRVEKIRPPIVPKLPDMSKAPEVSYELNADDLLAGGRRPMAIGLLWQPRSPGQSLQAQARAASVGDTDFDLSVLFANGAQAGFASTMDAHKAGMVAAATAIPREFTGDTWLGAFVLPIRSEMLQLTWWVVAHRDGQVYEDRLLRTEVEARETFLDLFDAPGWQMVFGPSNWQISEAQEVALGYLLPSASKGSKLASHNLVRVWAPRAAAAAVVLGLGLGGFLYWQNIEEKRRFAEEQEERERQRLAALAAQVAPWVGMPGLEEAAFGCAALINSTLANPPGWLLEPITCTITKGSLAVTTTWKREPGTTAKFLYATLENKGFPRPAFNADLGSASISATASIEAKEWGKELVPLVPDVMVTRLAYRFDSLTLPLELVAKQAPPPPADAALPEQKVWDFHEIVLESSTFLTNQIQLLGDIPAAVPQSITYDPTLQTWKLVANIYHPFRTVQTS